MMNNTTKRIAALALLALVTLGACADKATELPSSGPNVHTIVEPVEHEPTKPRPSCTEDEYTQRYDEFTLCVHWKGEGWRTIPR